jgi:adenylate cyclase
MRHVDPVAAWLINGAPGAPTRAALIEELCGRLTSVGVPVDRAGIFVEVLHPEIKGRSFIWRRGEPVEAGKEAFDETVSTDGGLLPRAWVQEFRVTLRRRLKEEVSSAFPLLDRLGREGFTDYLAAPIHFADGAVHVASWATRRACGFTEEDVAGLHGLGAPLARILEVYTLRRTAVTLLDTYVGRQAGTRVLAGHIHRGDTEAIDAAIWLSDMRGFTNLSDRLPPESVVTLLNRYFDSQVSTIEAHGGEVLKFMGDGLLAIFPITEEAEMRVCADVMAAARAARARILTLEEIAQHGEAQPFSLALHAGRILYGNIGGGRRLDFTVIGPAVNLTSRLERLPRDLGRSVVASERFARLCGEPLLPLGAFPLRGLPQPQPAFGLPEEG